MSPELKDVSEFYADRIGSKEREIKRLRDYIVQLESSEKRISAEYAGQIDEKCRQVKRLTELLRKREGLNEGVLKQLNRKVSMQKDYIDGLSSSLGKKEHVDQNAIEKLDDQIRAKNGEIGRLRVALFSREKVKSSLDKKASEKSIVEDYGKKAGDEKELDRLRSCIMELENSEKRISAEYAEQIAEKDRQVRRLVNMIKLREDSNRLLSEKLDGKIRNERDYVERIKNAITRKEEFNREVIEKLTVELARKNEEAERLRDAAIRQERLVRQLESEVVEYGKRQDSMEAFLHEKDSVRQKLEVNYAQQLKNREYEIERLSRDLRKQFDSKPAARSHEELAALKVKLEAKEAELSGIVQEFAGVKEQNRIALKRLDERQKLFVESENTYNSLINSLQLQQEKRVKELMHTNSQREVELKTEIEKLKAGQREKETLLAEKGSRIDETLLQFSEMSRKLLELKGIERAEGRGFDDTGLKEQQEEISRLLKEAEERISEAVRKEQEVARREELLVKEQDAINAELSILKNAGFEVQKEKDYLKAKIRHYEAPGKEAKGQTALAGEESVPEAVEEAWETLPERSEAPIAQEAVEEAPVEEIRGKAEVLEILRRPENQATAEEKVPVELKAGVKKGVKPVFRQAISKVKHLPRPPVRSMKAKVERPKIREELVKQAAKMDAFPEVGGYGEIHEITSIIDIGLQHGDSVEQIRSSLESSGYSRHNIEKAFRLVKKT